MKNIRIFSITTLANIYLSLLIGTGYIAFFDKGVDPSSENYKASTDYTVYQNASEIGDEGARQSFIQALGMLNESTKRKLEFAFQSFNIVLGATLGFLSALATRNIGMHLSDSPVKE